MRLLIYGSRRNQNTVASFFIRNLSSSIQFEILEFPDEFARLLSLRIYRIIFKLFPVILIRRMDRLFLRQINAFRPTVVLIFKGMEISRASLAEARRKGIRLINYNFDHPYIFFSRGTGNRFVREAIPYYDLHISYSSVIVKDLAQKFKVRTAWIPFGFHLSDEEYDNVVDARRPEINRACFVGNPDELRVATLKRLVENNVPVSVYGFGWEKFLEAGKLIEIQTARKPGSFWSDPGEFWRVLRQYRVQLNFFRPHNEGSHNLRTFEVPAVGGILLTPESDEQKFFFKGQTEIFFYTSFDNLLAQCRYLMSADIKEIENVRTRARAKSVSHDYSYPRRTRDLVLLLHNLEKEKRNA